MSALRVRNGNLTGLAEAIRCGQTTLSYNGRTGGKRISSAAMCTFAGSYNNATRVQVRRDGGARMYQVKPRNAPQVRHRELTAQRWGQRNTQVRTAMCAGITRITER